MSTIDIVLISSIVNLNNHLTLKNYKQNEN